MRKHTVILLISLAALTLASCGAIPTLPPLDSTIVIWTPQVTPMQSMATATNEAVVITITPSDELTEEPQDPTATSEPPTPTTEPYTPTPGITAEPSDTPEPTATAKAEPTLAPTAVPYSLQQMNPYYLMNFTHDDLGCDWMGVAGQIFNIDGQVQKDIVIRAGGEINGRPLIEEMVMPLAEPEIDLAYGPGGFELTLAEVVADTDGEVWIQLFSLDGDTRSDKIYLTTYDNCQKNLILLNFVEK